MKKNFYLLFLLSCLIPFGVSAQISETFAGLTLTSTTVGTATYNIGGLPAGWAQNNVDGLTPNAALSYMGTNAWISREITYTSGAKDTVAQSISWYSAAGTSNDYLITPLFMVPGASTFLTWQGYTQDANFPDGYEVRISTTGTLPSDFSTVLTTVAAENATGFVLHAASLAAFAGQNIYVAFRNNSNDKFVLFIDDIQTQNITNVDAQMVSLSINRFEPTNTNVTLGGTIYNKGIPINALNISWTDGGAPNTASLTGLNIAPFSSYNFTLPTVPFNKPATGEFNLTVAITSVNSGATESDVTNNSASAKLSTVANPPQKNVVIEEGTGFWCGWCPRGAVAMEHMDQTHTDGSFIGIAVHNGDPITVTNYDAGAAFSGFPGCNVDRTLLGGNVSNTDFDNDYNYFSGLTAPAAPTSTLSYNAATKTITINASIGFKTTITDPLRMLCVIVEDSVHNAAGGTAWEQHNYYSSASQNLPLVGAGHNWQTEGTTVPATNMWYFHVGRALLQGGNYGGDANTVPGPVVDGYTASKTFTYTIPTDEVAKNISVVTMLVDETSGAIYNAHEVKLQTNIGINNVSNAENIAFNVTPNLTNGTPVNVSFETKGGNASVQVYNFAGQVSYSKNLGNVTGKQNLTIETNNMVAGEYFVAINLNGTTHVQHLSVTK